MHLTLLIATHFYFPHNLHFYAFIINANDRPDRGVDIVRLGGNDGAFISRVVYALEAVVWLIMRVDFMSQ